MKTFEEYRDEKNAEIKAKDAEVKVHITNF